LFMIACEGEISDHVSPPIRKRTKAKLDWPQKKKEGSLDEARF